MFTLTGKFASFTSLVVMVVRILRVSLGLVFFSFGLLKLWDGHGFVVSVANFQIRPFDSAPWDMYLAYFLVSLEVMAGGALLLNKWMRGSLIVVVAMTLAFMVAIGSVWVRGLNIDCGCTSGTVSLGGYETHLTILAGMLAAGIYLIIDEIFPTSAP